MLSSWDRGIWKFIEQTNIAKKKKTAAIHDATIPLYTKTQTFALDSEYNGNTQERAVVYFSLPPSRKYEHEHLCN